MENLCASGITKLLSIDFKRKTPTQYGYQVYSLVKYTYFFALGDQSIGVVRSREVKYDRLALDLVSEESATGENSEDETTRDKNSEASESEVSTFTINLINSYIILNNDEKLSYKDK